MLGTTRLTNNLQQSDNRFFFGTQKHLLFELKNKSLLLDSITKEVLGFKSRYSTRSVAQNGGLGTGRKLQAKAQKVKTHTHKKRKVGN